MNQFLLAFITGLTSGGISCVAVQGGLLAATIADSGKSKTKATLLFLIAKTLAYTVLGGFLGLFGTSFIISSTAQGWFLILVGVFMIATAGRLLNIHPIFRYLVIQPPVKFLRVLSRVSKDTSGMTPVLLGFLTVLIPCGVTQAMMIYAIGSGSVVNGALTMFAFVLGTFPVFFLFGLASVEIFKNKLLTIAASVAIIYIGLTSINSGQVLRGSVHTFQNYWKVLSGATVIHGKIKIENGYQIVKIDVFSKGYRSDTNTLKLNVPVKLTLVTNNVLSCALAFVIPSMGISKVLPVTGETVVEFTPTKTGVLTYTCSMGMYTGYFNVVK